MALGLALATGCTGEPPASLGTQERALYGAEGDYEFAVDAPWRIEPTLRPGSATLEYGTIPIVITIDDAHLAGDHGDSVRLTTSRFGTQVLTDVALGQFVNLRVIEPGFGATDFALDQFHEVERVIGPWPKEGAPAPTHTLCKRWAGQSCAGLAELSHASEWHGLVHYRPAGPVTPGRDVRLDFELRATRIDRNDPDHPGYVTFSDVVLKNGVSVRLAEAPLPRFDDTTWAYGDLHYHSQGTDNEGESGYAYRGVLHAMAAIGLDFALASEHASSSPQIDDVDLFSNLGDIFDPLHPTERRNALRDMSPERFRHLWGWLNLPGGANQDAASEPRLVTPTRARAPRIFLGGEVDVVPETVDRQTELRFGNGFGAALGADYGLRYDIRAACDAYKKIPWIPDLLLDECKPAQLGVSRGDGRWTIRDMQGTQMAEARQHLLHLPRAATGAEGFLASDTTYYGGARYRLGDLLSRYDHQALGDFFLAHPLDFPTSTGASSLGPDIIPYSSVQLDDAFASQHFLGLQLWNSNTRRTIDATFDLDRLLPWVGTATAWQESEDRPGVFRELYQGTAAWDQLLLKGLDPDQTRGLRWLPANQPRRVFMAGGSDAHGDLNYRRKGYMVVMTGTDANDDIDDLTDTVMGTPRNLVHTGAPEGPALSTELDSRTLTQDQVFGALARGEFTVTDGPALRLAWDVNRNDEIDDADIPMGGTLPFHPLDGPPPLLVEWKSTAEFGPVTGIDLYVGALAQDRGWSGFPHPPRVYAPAFHGVRSDADRPGAVAHWFNDQNRWLAGGQLDDGYFVDPSRDGRLRIDTSAAPMGGTRHVAIDPLVFRVGDATDLALARGVVTERLYVRAFARTDGRVPAGGCAVDRSAARRTQRLQGDCIPRLAYTNPVWAIADASVTRPPARCETAAFDSILPAGVTTAETEVHPFGELTFTARSTCTRGAPQYRMLEQNYRTGIYTWFNDGAWQTSPIFRWGAGKLEGDTSRLFLEVRSTEGDHPNFSEAPVPTTVHSFSAHAPGHCESVALTFSTPAPATAGRPVTLTASSTCSAGVPEYQFYAYNHATGEYVWLRTGWSADPVFGWQPPGSAASSWNVYVNVHARWSTEIESTALSVYRFTAPTP